MRKPARVIASPPRVSGPLSLVARMSGIAQIDLWTHASQHADVGQQREDVLQDVEQLNTNEGQGHIVRCVLEDEARLRNRAR